jgi:hypothetical protein
MARVHGASASGYVLEAIDPATADETPQMHRHLIGL